MFNNSGSNKIIAPNMEQNYMRDNVMYGQDLIFSVAWH